MSKRGTAISKDLKIAHFTVVLIEIQFFIEIQIN